MRSQNKNILVIIGAMFFHIIKNSFLIYSKCTNSTTIKRLILKYFDVFLFVIIGNEI